MTAQVFVITRAESGLTVADLLRRRLRLSWSQARRLVQEHRVRLAGSPCPDPASRVKAGQRVELFPLRGSAGDGNVPHGKKRRPKGRAVSPRLPEGLEKPIIRHADAEVIVVDKPAGLTTMRHAEETAEFGSRARRFLPPTLADLLPALLAKAHLENQATPVLPIHRLDKETSGLVVFARTPAAASHLGKQFRAHSIDRCYLALVRGQAQSRRIESNLVEDRGDGRRGSTTNSADGKRAVTEVLVIEDLGAFSVVECRLETGRTHQVRIHLGEQGTPLCGDHIYDRPPHGAPLPDGSQAKRPMLHAARLGFTHPRTGTVMAWEAPLPPDMARLVHQLRTKRRGEGPRG